MRIIGTLVKRALRMRVPAIVISLAAAAALPAIAQTWSESVAAYVGRDFATAYRGFRNHAEQGHAPAQYRLGVMYYLGHGVSQDFAEAAMWYARAGQQGDVDAQVSLGLMYAEGRGVLQSHPEALRWFRRAAELNDSYGQHYLGTAYHAGRGTPKDMAQAIRWYRRAAEQGLADAQSALGFLYRDGSGVPQDYLQAAKWFRRGYDRKLWTEMKRAHPPKNDSCTNQEEYAHGEGYGQKDRSTRSWVDPGRDRTPGSPADAGRGDGSRSGRVSGTAR